MKFNLNINITNKILYVSIFMFVFLIGSIFTTAYGTSEPSVFGHTASEIAEGLFGGDETDVSDIWAFQEGKVGIGTTTPTETLDR